MSEDDLSQRDLSQIDDADLTPEERRELQRRLEDFLSRVRGGTNGKKAKAKPKRVSRWTPGTTSNRH